MMASFLAKPGPVSVRRLHELLQENQEPFLLDVYLLERGYLKKSSKSEGRSGCCLSNSSQRLGCYGIPHCSRVVRSILNKLLLIYDNRKTSNCETRAYEDGRVNVSEMGGGTHPLAESYRFSSASSLTVFDSCSKSDLENESPSFQRDHISSSTAADNFRALKLSHPKLRDIKLQRGCIEDTKQLSLISVLEDIPSNKVSSLQNHMQYCHRTKSRKETPSTSNTPSRVSEDSIFSASLWELLVHSLVENHGLVRLESLHELHRSDSSSYHLKSESVSQQTKQLLFDCVREVVEIHETKGRRCRHDHKFLGPEELGKIICEQICSWGKQCGDVTNITQLIDADFSDPIEEWCGFQPHIRNDIGIEIADAILEEIRKEIVTNMIDFF